MRRFNARTRLLTAAVAACYAATPAWALPTAPVVTNGSATFAQSGTVLNVTNSHGAVINWNSFNVGAGETTRFIQSSASSSVLNRVVTADPSQIYGTLTSNGRVWLINPSGILVGPGARIDTAGFVASTLNISDQNFLAGRLNFQNTGGAGNVVNQGTITTPAGGTVYLVGNNVSNEGIITTPGGETLLAAGQTVDLIDTATPGIKVEITGAAGNTTNLGSIVATAGRIGMAGVIVRNAGQLNASSVVNEGGRVFLKAAKDTYVDGAGRIVATGTKGGRIEVLGERVAVMDQASLDASGTNGGGTVLVGGDYQGANPDVQNAQISYFGPDASIRADATVQGDGGKVVVWADDTTRAHGGISVRGGAAGGDGGFVETSGRRHLDVTRAPDLRAPQGKGGSWLLDPEDITISSGYGSNITATSPFQPVYGGASNVDGSVLRAAIEYGGTVTVDTTYGGGTGAGNILVASTAGLGSLNIGSYGGAATLNLKAHNDITAYGSIASVGNPLTINLIADQDNNGTGKITLAPNVCLIANNASVTLSAAQGIELGAGAKISTANISDLGGGWADLNLTANANGGNGDFTLASGARLITAKDVNINANNITLSGTIERVQNNAAVGLSTATLKAADSIALNTGAHVFESSTAYGFDVNLLAYGGGAGSGNVTLTGARATNISRSLIIAGWDGTALSTVAVVNNTDVNKGKITISDSVISAKTVDWTASGDLTLGSTSQTIGVSVTASYGSDPATGHAPMFMTANNIYAKGSTSSTAYGNGASVGISMYYGAGVILSSTYGGQQIHAKNAMSLEAGSVNNTTYGGAGYGGSVQFIAADYQNIRGKSLALYGGVAGHDNFAIISAYGDQQITLGDGAATPGSLWLESKATGSSYNNTAKIEHGQRINTSAGQGTGSQALAIYGGGTVTLRGGAGNGTQGFYNSECGPSCTESNNQAEVRNVVGTQTLDFVYGGSIALTGGSAGYGNGAVIDNDTASLQKIWSSYGAGAGGSGYYPSITLTGGSSGGKTTWGGAGYGGQVASLESTSFDGSTTTVTLGSVSGLQVGDIFYVDVAAGAQTPTGNGTVTAIAGNQVTLSAAPSNGMHALTFARPARTFRIENQAGLSVGDKNGGGSQQISSGAITIVGGGNATTVGGAYIGGGTSTTIAAYGNVALTGGASNVAAADGMATPAAIGTDEVANVTLNIYGGTLTMTGGTGSYAPALIGSLRNGGSVSIDASNGIVLNAGTSKVAIGSAAPAVGYGATVTLASGANIAITGTAAAPVQIGAAYGSGSATATSVRLSAYGDIVTDAAAGSYGSYIGLLNSASSGSGANHVGLKSGYYNGAPSATGGKIDLTGSVISAGGGGGATVALTSYGAGDIALARSSVAAVGNLAVTAARNVSLTNTSLYGGIVADTKAGWNAASAAASTTGGNITLADSQILSTTGAIALAANNGASYLGGIYNSAYAAATAPLLKLASSGSITLTGREIGLPNASNITGDVGAPITLDPGSGTVSATASAGGINLRQSVGNLVASKYTISDVGSGNHIHLQAAGNIDFDSLAGFNANTENDNLVLIAGGSIGQSAALTTTALYTTSGAGTILNTAGNRFASFAGTNSGGGNIVVSDATALSLGTIANSGGNVTITSGGALSQSGTVTASGLATTSYGGTILNGNNTVASFAASNSGGGNVAFNNTGAVLSLGTIANSGGNVAITTSGILSQTGTVTANGLTTTSYGSTALSGSNNVASLTATNTGGGAILFTNAGALSLGNIVNSGGAVVLNSGGALSQTGAVSASSLTTTSYGGTTLTGANQVTAFGATNYTSGNIALTNTSNAAAMAGSGTLTITGIANYGNPGNIVVDNVGGITTAGAVSAAYGSVTLTAHSPINIYSSVTAGAGNIALSATSGIALSAAASLSAPAGSVNATTTSGTIVVPVGATVSVGSGGTIAFTAAGSGNIDLQGTFSGATPTRSDSTAAVSQPVLDVINQTTSTTTTTATNLNTDSGTTGTQTNEIPPPTPPAIGGPGGTLPALGNQTIGGTFGQFGGGDASPPAPSPTSFATTAPAPADKPAGPAPGGAPASGNGQAGGRGDAAPAASEESKPAAASGDGAKPAAESKDAGKEAKDTKDATDGKDKKDSKDKKDDKKSADSSREKKDDKASGKKPVGKCSA